MVKSHRAQRSKTDLTTAPASVRLLPSYQWALFFAALCLIGLLLALGIFRDNIGAGQTVVDHKIDAVFTALAYTPYLFVWLVARMGYTRLKRYIATVKTTSEGRAFAFVARGVFLITAWLPISATVTIIASILFYQQIWFVPYVALFIAYANTLFFGFAYWYIYKGSQNLLHGLGKSAPLSLWANLAYITFAVLFVALILRYPIRLHTIQGTVFNDEVLPVGMQLLTVVLPRLLSWYLGLQAACNIFAYRRYVPGKIYKEMLSNLSAGLAGVVVLSIILRGLQTLNLYIGLLSLQMRLMVLYCTLALLGAGFFFLARGATKLHRLENM